MIARLILFISQFKLLIRKTWNVICGNYEYIIQMHGKVSCYAVCGRVSTAVHKLVILSVQVRKLVWKLSLFPNNF